ncbi:MAG: outer membrane lipoprotein-sorting protein [Hymenobacteraceae bacterium]|nr:outer membrane lipoprotein-sorting protein [Hymenobacteraceae bacterium]MDX5481419.1 outer membrane lipoprotein-sorting protein [Hymenobacteraceae bacterium]
MPAKKLLKQVFVLWMLYLIGSPAPVEALADPDPKARKIAQMVMRNMGGEEAWNNTRYLAWTFNNQYQVWDKHQNRFRWEKDSLVAIIDTETKDGKVYVAGQELQNPEERQKLLERAYALWINNSYWLVMPFKLQDPGVNLKYVGEEETMDGATAEVLEMTFEKVGLTPQNKYKLWVDKEQGLITQWAFFRNSADAEPAFTRRWSNYKDYGGIKLASDRSNPQSDFELFHIAAPEAVPDEIFNSPVPVGKF